jgi:LysM repeat protein
MKRAIFFCLIVGLVFILSSCATAPVKQPVMPAEEIYPQSSSAILRQDIYHVVGPGETIWRISKIYDVRMEDVVRVNNIKKPEEVEMGQRLLIPQAAPIRPVISLYKSDKWKYIIIHHSATDKGNALDFNELHKRKGWDGIGYDFVIDNGTDGKADGQIEVSPRWLKQEDGAHCKASGMNQKGIGICLVGNFSKETVSQKQMDSLVYLVGILAKYYKIPPKNIMGHGQVPDASTECPGKNFPWKEFYNKLNLEIQ